MSRRVESVLPGIRTVEGEGFVVRRPFPSASVSHLDPFLLLDEMGPNDYAPGEAKGAPDHPHRGFETVTYLLEGDWEHEDSVGNRGFLGAGGVQWMTAGAGVIHSEMPAAALREGGGRLHGFQLWVNLPRVDKMMPPRYQDTQSDKIPVAEDTIAGVRVKVIAGEALGKQAVIDTRTPILYLHYTLQPGAVAVQPVAESFNVFAYVYGGEGTFGENETKGADGQLLLFEKGGEEVRFTNTGERPLDVLLIGGEPLNEPVARYGPFVMNYAGEIRQAMLDYQSGRLGRIDR